MTRGLAPVAIALLVALAVACFRLETTTADRGPGREARANPWLAAGRLLESQGLRVRHMPVYGGLPDPADILLLATPLDFLDAGEQDALLRWVQAGGHLVTAMEDSATDAEGKALERLARRFDVRLQERRLTPAERVAALRDNGLRPLQADREGRLEAGFDPVRELVPGAQAASWIAGDAYGVHVLRLPLGRGHVTLLSDLDWSRHPRLGQGDHGALLLRVVDGRAGARIWLVPGEERPSLFALLRDKARPLLVSLSLFVLAWLWAASRRFGPLQPAPAPARRRLAEHLDASGHYLLRHGGLPLLFDASRQRLLAQAQRRHPQWRSLSAAALAAQLAQRAGVESAAVERVLAGDPPLHLLQFTADIRLLNRLRKAL